MFSVRIEGGEDLARALKSLSEGISKPIMREALADAAEPIRRTASLHAKRRSPAPDLADHIVISKGRNPEGVSVAVGPEKAFYHGLFLEYGTVKMSAQPFLRPAFDENTLRVIQTMSAVLWQLLAAKGVVRTETANVPVQSQGGSGLL